MRCISFCTAENYALSQIISFFKTQGYTVKQYRKVLHITHPQAQSIEKHSATQAQNQLNSTLHPYRGDIFIFSYGCMVLWGLTRKQVQSLLENIKPFSINPLKTNESDRFVYRYGDSTEVTTHETFSVDIISLESDHIQLKLAISYALAQSIQLESYESAIQKTIEENAHFPQQLAQRGTLKLSSKDISKRMGKIFLARSLINLNSDYLEEPEYFWEHPNFANYYTMSKRFLDIPRRVAALNQKLDTLHEMFEILTSQRQNHHANTMELTIILLIAIEIIISLVLR